MSSNELAICRAIEDFVREKGLDVHHDLIESVIQSNPEYVEGYYRYKELKRIKESPVDGLKQEDFYRFAKRYFSITLKTVGEESVEEFTQDWVDLHFRRSWNYSISIWWSEFRDAERTLDLMLSELKTRSDEYDDWMINLAGEAVCEG